MQRFFGRKHLWKINTLLIDHKESGVIIALMAINTVTITWAKQQYPQFLLPHLGEKRRYTHLMSRALLLSVLQQYYDPGITALPELSYNQHQKPSFISAPYLFNLTHTEDAVAVIILPLSATTSSSSVAPMISIGIDLEKIQPRRGFPRLLERTFTPIERAWILEDIEQSLKSSTGNPAPLSLSLNSEAQRRFFLLWSTKEAYLKADGRGLQGLKSLEINPLQQALYGDLRGGKLYAGTTSFNQQAHSIALYLPENSADHLKITALQVTSNGATFSSAQIKWDLTLSDTPKQHISNHKIPF